MKITTISKVASLVISSMMIQTAVAGHAVGIGVGPHFGGGGFGGGIFEMLFGGAGRPAQSRGDHSRLDRYDAGAAFYPLPSLERRS